MHSHSKTQTNDKVTFRFFFVLLHRYNKTAIVIFFMLTLYIPLLKETRTDKYVFVFN